MSCDPDCLVRTPFRAKNGRKMDFGPSGKIGEKWPKMGKIAKKWVKNANFPIFGPFFSHFPGGAEIDFSAIFFPFPEMGSVPGNQDRKS